MSETPQKSVDKVVLVAPYKDYDKKYGDFSDYNFVPSLVERTGRLTIIHSTDDDGPIARRTEELVTALPTANYIELEGFGHFRIGHNMSSEEFPILLDELTKN
jgi:predicted alpha/beta hydrolase family esterase